MDIVIHCSIQDLVEMCPSEVAAELADQKEERLGKSSEHAPESASPGSYLPSYEAGDKPKWFLFLEAPESCTVGNFGRYRPEEVCRHKRIGLGPQPHGLLGIS